APRIATRGSSLLGIVCSLQTSRIVAVARCPTNLSRVGIAHPTRFRGSLGLTSAHSNPRITSRRAMGFANSTAAVPNRAPLMTPTLKALLPSGVFPRTQSPTERAEFPVGLFLRPCLERPHERDHRLARVWRRRLRGRTPPGGGARLGAARPR